MISIQPYTIDIAQEVLDDLQERLRRTRWPNEIAGTGWRRGADLSFMKKLVEYWLDEYDWRQEEARLNEFAHFKADVDGLVKETLDRFGRVDILVNTPGYSFRTDAADVPISDWEDLMAVNLTGAFRCAQAFGRFMIEQGKGSIIFISSIAGMVALGRGQAAYCSSKHGLIGLTRELAIEWGQFNVRVNAIAPCQVATEGLLKWVGDSERDGELYEGRTLREHLTSQIPLGRFAEPEEYVGPTVFLASDAGSMVTGHVLAVDGGYLAR